jgi:hypothetical protein
LGGLLHDQRPNVRRNIATLAASLAGRDSAALEALVAIAVEGIRNLLREASAADAELLETVLAEREALPDETLKAKFDEQVAQKLGNSIPERDALVRTENLLRLPSAALPLVPVELLVDAFMSDARRLAGTPRGKGDPFERERLQARLSRLAAFENQAPLDLRNALLQALAQRLRRLERRFPVLLVLLQIVPTLLELKPGTAAIANPAEIDKAARAGRPHWLRVVGRSLTFAFVTGGALAMLMACVLTVSHGSNAAKILGNAALECLRIGFIALTAAVPAAFLYTPSLGRSFRVAKSLRRALVPAIAAGLVAAGITVLFRDGDITLGLVLSDTPVIFYLLLFAAIATTVSIVTAMVPSAVRAYIQTGDSGEIWAIACAAGPALGAGTMTCGVAALLGFTALSQLWPLLMATAATSAVSLTNIEKSANPTHPLSSAAERSWWPNVAVLSSAVPPALAAIGVVLSLSSAETSTDRQLAQSIECRTPGAHCNRDFVLQPGTSVMLTFQDPAKLRADFDIKGHEVLILPTEQGAKASSGKHAIMESGASICVDQCEGFTWPWESDWLRVLVTGHGKVRLLGQFTAPAPGPTGGETMDLTKAASGVKVEAGEPEQLEVPAGKHARIEVEGQGLSEDDPALLKVFGHEKNNDLTELQSNRDSRSHTVEPGTYLVCVYFHAIEHSTCNLKDPNRVVYETGQAIVKISLQDAPNK